MWTGFGQAPAAQPRQGWLSHERIAYIRDVLELILLLLGLPYLLYRLLSDPAGLMKGLGRSREA